MRKCKEEVACVCQALEWLSFCDVGLEEALERNWGPSILVEKKI